MPVTNKDVATELLMKKRSHASFESRLKIHKVGVSVSHFSILIIIAKSGPRETLKVLSGLAIPSFRIRLSEVLFKCMALFNSQNFFADAA